MATLLSDAGRGNFQLIYARWVGANHGHYSNPRIDGLTDQIHVESNQEKRKALSEVQIILAGDLPYIFL